MPGDKTEIKHSPMPRANKEGVIIVNEAVDAVYNDSKGIDSKEKHYLEVLASVADKANIMISANNKGALIICSNGSIDEIGKFDHSFKKPNKEEAYMIGEINDALKTGNTIDDTEKAKIKALNEILKDVAIVINDKHDGAMLVSSEGHAYSINKNNHSKPAPTKKR